LNRIFTVSDNDTDFRKLKKQGVCVVLSEATKSLGENIKKAASCKLDIWVKVPAKTRNKVQVLVPHAGRISVVEGSVKYVGVKDLKRIIADVGSVIDNVAGFIIPVPQFDGPIWSLRIEKLLKTGLDEMLYELFDEEKEVSSVRSWYYSNISRYIAEKYMKPQREYLENLGLRAVFRMSEVGTHHIFENVMINPLMSEREGFCVADGDGIFVDKPKRPKILLVKPTRGVMERYIHRQIKPNRVETPALSAMIEGVYYCDMLARCGYSYDVADEYSFDENGKVGSYKHIIVCESCLFSETEIRQLKKSGAKINDQKLMSELSIKGEEEWEK